MKVKLLAGKATCPICRMTCTEARFCRHYKGLVAVTKGGWKAYFEEAKTAKVSA